MRKKLSALVVLFTLSSIPVFTAGNAIAAPPAPDFDAIPIEGTTGGVTVFDGTFDVNRFAAQGGKLVAVGTLEGTLTTATGPEAINQSVTLPVTINQATCQILDLTLGPLDLNLLGLMVHLDEVNLTITAQQGPGNLLGNLLCAIAGLLDNTNTPLNIVAQLLNQLLGLFG